MEFLVILVYAGLLALVAPFVLGNSERVGRLVPAALAIVSGSILWVLLTWLGFSSSEVWIWFVTMLLMPVAVFFGTKTLEKLRETAEQTELGALRSKQ
jgi:Ca2+/Na+ antiporter